MAAVSFIVAEIVGVHESVAGWIRRWFGRGWERSISKGGNASENSSARVGRCSAPVLHDGRHPVRLSRDRRRRTSTRRRSRGCSRRVRLQCFLVCPGTSPKRLDALRRTQGRRVSCRHSPLVPDGRRRVNTTKLGGFFQSELVAYFKLRSPQVGRTRPFRPNFGDPHIPFFFLPNSPPLRPWILTESPTSPPSTAADDPVTPRTTITLGTRRGPPETDTTPLPRIITRTMVSRERARNF